MLAIFRLETNKQAKSLTAKENIFVNPTLPGLSVFDFWFRTFVKRYNVVSTLSF